MKKLHVAILMFSSLLSGCASLNQNFSSSENINESTYGPYGYKNKFYAGVKEDVGQIVGSCYFFACITAPIGIIDMPFSFVVDTLLLPYNGYKYQLNKNKLAACVENKRKLASEARNAGIGWKDDDVWCKKYANQP